MVAGELAPALLLPGDEGSCLRSPNGGVPMKTAEFLEIQRRAKKFDETEAVTRAFLIRRARAGDLKALALLHERYHLRLPLVENALKLGTTRN
jgi:hypothetical protein